MTDKKNIERLFQEKFKDFEVNPAPEAWENIAARLEKKEDKKRVFPFWFNAKAAGIAAALVLGFFGLNNYSNWFSWNLNSDANRNETVVLQENGNHSKTTKNKNTNTNTSSSDLESLSSSQESSTVAATNHEIANGKDATTHEANSNSIVNASKSASPNIKKEKTKQSNTNIQPSIKYLNNSNEVFVANEKNKPGKVTKIVPETTSPNKSSLVSQDRVAFQKNNRTQSTYNTAVSKDKQRFVKNQKASPFEENNNNDVIASKNNLKDENPTENTGNEKWTQSGSKSPNNSSVVLNDKEVFQKDGKPSLDKNAVSNEKESLEQNQNNTIVGLEKSNSSVEGNTSNALIAPNALSTTVVAIDSSKNSAIEENPLEKILREKEQEKLATNTEDKKEKKKSDWLLKPTVAPIFMFAKNGSPIDEKFVDNSKSYNNTVSVGIGLEKRLSDKFYFRTSVNNLDLSYNTNDIAYYSTLNFGNPSARGMGNISVSQSALFTTIVDSRDTSLDNSEVLQNKKEGYLNQKISYVEIPLEVSYKIVDKKLGIQVMTGMSTLFLNKNQVSLVSDKFSSDLGEANNLNIVHFSTNIGLGFKYKFFKSFEASVEPTFKYQLFTFHTNAGGFKPYIIGLYSGVSYRF